MWVLLGEWRRLVHFDYDRFSLMIYITIQKIYIINRTAPKPRKKSKAPDDKYLIPHTLPTKTFPQSPVKPHHYFIHINRLGTILFKIEPKAIFSDSNTFLYLSMSLEMKISLILLVVLFERTWRLFVVIWNRWAGMILFSGEIRR